MKRPVLLAWFLRLVAAALVVRAIYVYPAGAPWATAADASNVLAVLALSVRWSHPRFRTQAMIAAFFLAALSFVLAQRSGQL